MYKTINDRQDWTENLSQWLRDLGGCAGTIQQIGGRELPCIGDGFVMSRYFEQTDGSINPTSVFPCPCRGKSHQNIKNAENKFGREGDIGKNQHYDLTNTYISQRKSVFITGSVDAGKTTIAYAAARNWRKTIGIYIGHELLGKFRDDELDRKSGYPELIIWDDADKIRQRSDFSLDRIWSLFNLVKNNKITLLITSNLSVSEFAELLCPNETERASISNRLNKFEVIDL